MVTTHATAQASIIITSPKRPLLNISFPQGLRKWPIYSCMYPILTILAYLSPHSTFLKLSLNTSPLSQLNEIETFAPNETVYPTFWLCLHTHNMDQVLRSLRDDSKTWAINGYKCLTHIESRSVPSLLWGSVWDCAVKCLNLECLSTDCCKNR